MEPSAPDTTKADDDQSLVWYVLVVLAGMFAVVFFAAQSAPRALVYVLLPVSLSAGGCAVLAAVWNRKSVAVERLGHRILALLFLLTLEVFWFSSRDWMHTLWSIQLPLSGLVLGSGVLLVRVWPEDRVREGALPHGWNGAAVALVGFLVLGSLPILLALLPLDTRPVGRPAASPPTALVEVAGYGLGGEIPSTMEPSGARQVARGLGSPPRFVTVTMAASMLAAGGWILFAMLALLGRDVQPARLRRSLLLAAPVLIAFATLFMAPGPALDRAIWRNEPWLVKAYGPVLVAAGLATLVLFFTIRRDEKRARVEG